MYKLGQRPHHQHRVYAVVILVIAGLVMAGAWAANKYLQPQTTLGTSEGTVRHVDVAKAATKHIDNDLFSMDIPKTWVTAKSVLSPAAAYAWHGTTKDDSPRRLELFVDDIPTSMAINRLMPLRASNNRVVSGGEISDNCVNFTDKKNVDRHTGVVAAKWAGVNFYCDAGNYLRNVVGTGAPGAINSVTVDGVATGTHRLFFVYTDHSAEPDYSVFSDILDSFRIH